MKPWIKRSLFGLFGAILLVGGLSACGRLSHHDGALRSAQDQIQLRGKMVERVASKLDLNAEQT